MGERAVEIGVTALPADGSFVIALLDVTERAREVRVLSETVGRLEDIMDNSAALIYVKDTEGRYMLVNQHFERRFGLRREDVIGRTDREVFPLEAAIVYEAHDREVMRTGRALEVEEPATGIEDGSWLSVKFPLLDRDGAAVRARRHLDRHHRPQARRGRGCATRARRRSAPTTPRASSSRA